MTSSVPSSSSPSDTAPAPLDPNTESSSVGELRMTYISDLLRSLESAAEDSGLKIKTTSPQCLQHENRLVAAKLGIASALHTALRCKHAPSAAHSLRVAIGCSTWAAAIGLPDDQRDPLEVAALLHDIGKIGVPDIILQKPGRLLPEELDEIGRHREAGADILTSCGAPPEVIATVVAAVAWFDGTNHIVPLKGEEIPRTARMLAIVDAFDSMTTDHVYRPAKSRERAIGDLFEAAGTQFDPSLVREFCEIISNDQSLLDRQVVSRWLAGLADDRTEIEWKPVERVSRRRETEQRLEIFQSRLIDNMHDGVIFVDRHRRIVAWNNGMERISGVCSSAAVCRVLTPSLFDMTDQDRRKITDERCPVKSALACGIQAMHRVSVLGRNGGPVEVDLHVIPVRGDDGALYGAALLLHDATSQVSLEERCQTLYAKATKDPLTQVANRAEFDRVLEQFIVAHEESGLPCSLIMTDIDYFKRINDTFGHQPGDEAIVTFAGFLKSMCRAGDLAARYGGEEFAVLLADCDIPTAVRRAEQIRRRLAEIPHEFLNGEKFTASFGVTELQSGDTPETMLRRADRALLQAKDRGRNRVVQLGEGAMKESIAKKWWPFGRWLLRTPSLVEATLVTNVPIEIAVQKLRGFIADRNAHIASIGEDEIRLEASDGGALHLRRSNDRPIHFVVDIKFSQEHLERRNANGLAAGTYVQTKAAVTIRPRRDRDRRMTYAIDRARLLLASLKSYLMAKEDAAEPVYAANP